MKGRSPVDVRPQPSSASVHIELARSAMAEDRLPEAGWQLQQVLTCLRAQTSEHVASLADLLVAFDEALQVTPLLWLETRFDPKQGWVVTVSEKVEGTKRVVVQVEGRSTDDTCQQAAAQIRKMTEEKRHDRA